MANDTTEAPEPVPCPFCGGEALVSPDSEHSTAFTLTHYSKGCPIDDLWDWYPDDVQAITAWNTRSDLFATVEAERDALKAENERLRTALADAVSAVGWGARRMESKSQAALMKKWAAEYQTALEGD